MRSFIRVLLIAIILIGLAVGCHEKREVSEDKPVKEAVKKEVTHVPDVQSPNVAGAFYPGDENTLRTMVRSFLEAAPERDLPGRVFGLMVPHAGYRFSGPVAAYAYKTIEGRDVKRFVILGPSHHARLNGVFVLDKDAYRTPLGLVKVDRKSARKLASSAPWFTTDERLYSREHSIEVQIPFIQEVAGDDALINVLMIGQINEAVISRLARLLYETYPPDETVFIASTDMSHGNYPPYKGTDDIRPVDLHTLDLVKAMDVEAIKNGLADRSTPMCGGLPVLTLMELFRLRGGHEVEVLHYADSGDATGDHDRVVGYGAAAFLISPDDEPAYRPEKEGAAKDSGYKLSDSEKQELLKIARAAVEAAVKNEHLLEITTDSDTLKQNGAAFVTLKNTGRLRGCIGSIAAVEPLYLCVQRRAVDAAIHDSRFFMNPIKPGELDDIKIEISVLTPTEPCSPDQVEVGRDGVLLSLGNHRGVFLPQVPVEQGWNREEYLINLCRKAGVMDPSCWKRPEARLECFQAVVFSE